MFRLTGEPLLTVMAVLAVAAPVVTAVLSSRQLSRDPAGRRAVARIAGRLDLVLLSQLLAMSALFLWVNSRYGFYTSWADPTGAQTQSTQIRTNGMVRTGSGGGSVGVLTMHGSATRTTTDSLVWLPPRYHDPHYAKSRFPVVAFLPGQPSTPQAVLQHYDFATIASSEIRAGHVRPFIAVFPPLMITPPRDTDCTDGGLPAESWLTTDVPAALTAHDRTEPPGRRWSVMGWSTGCFCAAELLLHEPTKFAAAVSFGGYDDPLPDSTTGDLFGGSTKVRDDNYPRWLHTHQEGLAGGRLLMVTGRQDSFAWQPTQQMLAVSRGDEHLAVLPFTTGGHDHRNYRAHLGPSSQWLAAAGVTG